MDKTANNIKRQKLIFSCDMFTRKKVTTILNISDSQLRHYIKGRTPIPFKLYDKINRIYEASQTSSYLLNNI